MYFFSDGFKAVKDLSSDKLTVGEKEKITVFWYNILGRNKKTLKLYIMTHKKIRTVNYINFI